VEGKPELVPDQLFVQPLKQSCGHRLPGEGPDGAVQLGVLERLTLLDRAAHPADDLLASTPSVLGV
jgi:hypothetical protein